MSESHQMKVGAGRYSCTDCDFDTLNKWVAKAHYAEKNGLDYEIQNEFRA